MTTFNSETFASPTKPYRPLTRWWWTALDVTRDELLREIAEMDEKAFYGCEIQTLATMDPELRNRDPEKYQREHRYVSDFYFGLVRAVMAECQKRDMIVDLTVGSCWPIGGTFVTPEDSLKTLLMSAVYVGQNGRRTIVLPTAAQTALEYYGSLPPSPFPFLPPVIAKPAMIERLRLIKVTAARVVDEPGTFSASDIRTAALEFSSAIDLTDMVEDGILTWDFPDGCWQVFVIYAGPVYAEIMTDAKENPDRMSLVLDHFKAGAIERLLDHYIGRGDFSEFAGETFRSFFSDSFELDTQCFWSDDFLAEFQRRRGYDLSAYLPVIFVPERDSRDSVSDKGYTPCFDFPDGLGDRIRRDYEMTVADIFRENFLFGLKNWGEKHGLKSKVQCYGHAMDNLQSFGLAHIPETEQLAAGGSIDFMKLAGSAGLLYDRPIVTAESLVWGGQDYQVNPMKIKVASDRLFVSGVNQMIYHGFPYQQPDAAWPGSFHFHGLVGTFISRHDAIWPWLRTVNLAVARGQYLMQNGQTIVDVALFDRNLEHQFESGRAEELATGVLDGIDREDSVQSALVSQAHPPRTEWQIMAEDSRRLGNALMEAGYDYIHINEERLLQAALVEDGTLSVGKARLKILILPAVSHLTLTAATRIRELIDQGFPVLFCDLVPNTVPGYLKHKERSDELRSLLQNQRPTARKELATAMEQIGVRPGIQTDAPGLQHIHKKLGDLDLYLIRSRLPDSRMARVRLPVRDRKARWLDTWTGKVSYLAVENDEHGTTVELPLAPYGSAYVLLGSEPDLPAVNDHQSLSAVRASIKGKLITSLTDGWSMKFVSAVPDDAQPERFMSKITLGDWADRQDLKNSSGTGTYRNTFNWQRSQGPMVLDLGRVGDIAVVRVNGQEMPPMLIYPFAADITEILKEGVNELEVSVTNTLRNGMIGQGLFRGPRGRALSGLIGPVRLLRHEDTVKG